MPDSETLRRARADKKAGKAPSTQAGEFIREEMDHIREGEHGTRKRTARDYARGHAAARHKEL